VCLFVNDNCDAETIEVLHSVGVEHIAMRCAGFDRVDVKKANELGICVTRVPAYSPYAVAEHAVALILTLNRQIHKAYNRVRDGNFTLDGLVGFDLEGKTVGLIGTGKIGQEFAKRMKGFGVRLVGYDKFPNQASKDLGLEYMELDEMLGLCDIISLHVPLMDATYHIIDERSIALLKPGCMIINTSRGGLINTHDIVQGLKKRKVGSVGMDVYENEQKLFFNDMAAQSDSQAGASIPDYWDDDYNALASLPNVVITPHQAFLTQEALQAIASSTINSISEVALGKDLTDEIKV